MPSATTQSVELVCHWSRVLPPRIERDRPLSAPTGYSRRRVSRLTVGNIVKTIISNIRERTGLVNNLNNVVTGCSSRDWGVCVVGVQGVYLFPRCYSPDSEFSLSGVTRFPFNLFLNEGGHYVPNAFEMQDMIFPTISFKG